MIGSHSILWIGAAGNTHQSGVDGDRDFWRADHPTFVRVPRWWSNHMAAFDTGKALIATVATRDGDGFAPFEPVVSCGDARRACFAVAQNEDERLSTSWATGELAIAGYYVFQLFEDVGDVVATLKACAIDAGEPGVDDEFGLGVVSLACDEVEDREVRTATASLLALPGLAGAGPAAGFGSAIRTFVRRGRRVRGPPRPTAGPAGRDLRVRPGRAGARGGPGVLATGRDVVADAAPAGGVPRGGGAAGGCRETRAAASTPRRRRAARAVRCRRVRRGRDCCTNGRTRALPGPRTPGGRGTGRRWPSPATAMRGATVRGRRWRAGRRAWSSGGNSERPGSPGRFSVEDGGERRREEDILTRYDMMKTTCAALAVAVAATGLAGDGGPQATRTVALTLDAEEAIPALGVRQGHLTTLSLQDAAGAPRPIVEIKTSTDAIEVARLASHPHVATLRTSGRREAEGNLVVFVDGIETPVHLSVSPKAPPSPWRVVVSIEGAETRPDRPARASDAGIAPGAPVASRTETESIVRDYLLGHPEVIREALDPARQLVSKVEELRHEVVGMAGVPAAGDLAGAVTVVEFFDYRCGYCKRSVDVIREAIAQTGVRVELRDYPILGADSERASRIALAAGMQSRYEDAHFALMEREGGFGDDAVDDLASRLGIDAARLRTDMESAAVSERIEANRDLGAPARCHRDAGVSRRRATGGAGVAGRRGCGPDRGDDRSGQLTRRR